MANDFFDPLYSSDTIFRGQDDARCVTDELDAIEDDIYALENGKANNSHTHEEYAKLVHKHNGYADIDHEHNYHELINVPTSLPADGGNADTVGGKSINDLASAESVRQLQNLVGTTSVSEQISKALGDGDVSTTHSHAIASVVGLSDELNLKYEKPTGGIPKTDLDLDIQESLNNADMVASSLSEYATQSYVNEQVAGVIDASPDALNTLNELAAALGDDPNFATTITAQIGAKVDKVDGKQLSSNDYTDAEKTKLAGIDTGANKTIVDSELSSTSTNPVQNKVVNTAINNISTLVGTTKVSEQINNAIASKANENHNHTGLQYISGVTSDVQTQIDGKLDKSGGTMTGNLIVNAKSGSAIGLQAPNNSDGKQSYARIYKNTSATADYGLQIRDYAHGGDELGNSSTIILCDKMSSLADKIRFVRHVDGSPTYYQLYGEHNKPTLSDLGVSSTATELNYVDGVTSSIQTQLNGKAASSHGTHVTFTTTTPKAAGTAAVGSATTVSRSDHVHPVQTTVSGNAGSATKLANARTVQTNLGSTSTASFDGSANITPGVTGTLPIANGGTGATSASAAVTKLGIFDYVVAQGTSGIWTYRKWNSGVAECWGGTSISYDVSCTQQATGVYTDATFKSNNATLPSGLFTSVNFATSNVVSSGYSISQVNYLNTSYLTYRIWCPYQTTLSGVTVHFHVKGKWK